MTESITTAIGYLGACLTTISFLPQVIQTIRTKKTDEISLSMYMLYCSGVLCWLIYGISIANVPLIVANGISLCLATIMLCLKIKY